MAQFANFLNVPTEQIDNSGTANLFQNLLAGYQAAATPKAIQQQQQANQFANQIAQKNASPESMQLNDDLKRAQIMNYLTPKQRKLTNDEQILEDYLNATDPKVKSYYKALMDKNIAPAQGQMTALQKNIAYRDSLPVGSHKWNEVNNAIRKQTTDSQARQKSILATNIDKTLAQLNLDDLIRYSGVFGAGGGEIGKVYNAALAPFGHSSEHYKKYLSATATAKLLADQMRQFYGSSITPENIKRIETLSNPSAWNKSPDLVKAELESIINVLKSETASYKDSLDSGNVYNKNYSSPSQEAPQSPPGTVAMYKDGVWRPIPIGEVENAKKYGYSDGR